MSSLLQEWLSAGPLITDGGWGTQLQLRGLPLGAHPDLWNLEEPEKVESVASAYVDAGSDIILSNTFGSSRILLARHGEADKAYEISRAGAAISKKAALACTDRSVRVFASMGPSGVILMMGEVSEEELFDAFVEQATGLKDGGADAVVVETMSDPGEAALAVKAAKQLGFPVVASFTFDSGKNKDRTMMGTTVEEVVSRMSDAGADAVGSNCGQGIDGFIPICRRMREVTDLPIWMKGNAGLPEMVYGKTLYRQTPEIFAEKAFILRSEGANFIGGCCGSTPDYIRAIRKKFEK